MADIIDLVATDTPASEVSDAIKDLLYQKSAEKLDALKPEVAKVMFDEPVDEVEDEPETEASAEVEDETTVEPEEDSQEDG